MRLDTNADHYGYPALQFRDRLRKFARRPMLTERDVAWAFQCSKEEALRLMGAMQADGLLELTPGRERSFWRATIKGHALANAKATKPIPRAKAEAILEEFVQRVERVETDPYYLYRVKEAILFGSLVGEKPEVNDIDIAFELEPKQEDGELRNAQDLARGEEAMRAGRRFNDDLDLLDWPQREVELFLKSRKRALSLTSLSLQRRLVLSVPHRILWAGRKATSALPVKRKP